MKKAQCTIICLALSFQVFLEAGSTYLTEPMRSIDGGASFGSCSTSWMSNAGNAKANGVNPNGVLDKVAYPFSKQCYWSGKDMKNLESFNFCGNKQIAAQYRDLINSYISPRQIILHNENKEKLALLNRNLKELSPEDKEALELWASKNFQPNNVLIENESPNEFQSAKAALEWNLKRASAKQDVWWTKEDLQRWAHHDSDETVIIKFGDILKFDQKREDFVIKDSPVQLASRLFRALDKSTGGNSFNKRVAWPSEEIQSLRLIKAEDSNKSLFHMRLDQILKNYKRFKDHKSQENGNFKEFSDFIGLSKTDKTEPQNKLHQKNIEL
ncbi:expressed protein, partial [Phakopsora pachyrhizi]